MADSPQSQSRRTTSSLVTTAIKGAKDAGEDIVAADVHSGGFVRIFFVDPDAAQVSKEGNSCDDIFEAGSD